MGPIAEPHRPERDALTSDENGVRTHASGVFCLSYLTSDISARKPGSDTAVDRRVFPQHRALVGPIAEPSRPETVALASEENGGQTQPTTVLSYMQRERGLQTPKTPMAGTDGAQPRKDTTSTIHECFQRAGYAHTTGGSAHKGECRHG